MTIKLLTNSYSIDFDSKGVNGVNKYTVKFDPRIPNNSRELRKKVLKLVRDRLKEKLVFFIDWDSYLFSLKKVAELLQYTAELDGVKYAVNVEWV